MVNYKEWTNLRYHLGLFYEVMRKIIRNLSHNIRPNNMSEVYRLSSLCWKGNRYSNIRTLSLYLWNISVPNIRIIQEQIIHYTKVGLTLYVTARRAVQVARTALVGKSRGLK